MNARSEYVWFIEKDEDWAIDQFQDAINESLNRILNDPELLEQEWEKTEILRVSFERIGEQDVAVIRWRIIHP